MSKYLVVGVFGEDDEEFSRVMTADEIFGMMDMSDCFPISINVRKIRGYGEAPAECSFCGKWHDIDDPLKMAIVGDGEKVVGYGTDH